MTDTNANKRLLPLHIVAVVVLAMLLSHLYLPVMVILTWPITLIGLAPIAIGLVLVLLATWKFIKARTTIMPFNEPSALIDSGIYRLSRNPIYLGFTLWLVGAALLFGSLTPLFLCPVFPIVADLYFIRAEEKNLTEILGEPYVEYKQRVRRWL
ncbi:MAG: methyltransferase family protein [Planctomycetota bacterium]|jgi:protein-S-isoprenylcysteine O-methyltransferase Ste14